MAWALSAISTLFPDPAFLYEESWCMYLEWIMEWNACGTVECEENVNLACIQL